MSSFLGWARYYAGAGPNPASLNGRNNSRPSAIAQQKIAAARTAEDSGESQEVRLQRLLGAQEIKLEALRDEISDLNAEAVTLVKQSQDPQVKPPQRNQMVADAKVALAKCAERRSELAAGEKKVHNLRGQLSVLQTANANMDHAILIQQGADELEGTMAAMEQLNVEDNVDRLRDAAATVHEHSALLGEDMGLSGNPMAGAAQEYLVDEELEALMRAQHDDQMDALLGQMHAAPPIASGGAGGGKVPDSRTSANPLLAPGVNSQ
jgi:chromosome segregation ATPase